MTTLIIVLIETGLFYLLNRKHFTGEIKPTKM